MQPYCFACSMMASAHEFGMMSACCIAWLQYCGALFNLGKALDASGNSTAAAAAYLQALQVQRALTLFLFSLPQPSLILPHVVYSRSVEQPGISYAWFCHLQFWPP